jgi:hypothetical protein
VNVLLTGWFSFRNGEVSAGDVLSLRAVRNALDASGVPYDVAWSRGFRGDGVDIETDGEGVAGKRGYTHLVFVSGPLYGERLRALHRRFAGCRRFAVGVSVIDPDDPAVTGFDRIWPRDAPASMPRRDLSALERPAGVPVVGVALTGGQHEYGDRRRHQDITKTVTEWVARQDCARLPIETRLDATDWRLARSPEQLESLVRKLDLMITMRLHGMVLALKNGVPAIAVDPVQGGSKVAAQARAWDWPAIFTPETLHWAAFKGEWDWCLSPAGRSLANNCQRHQTVERSMERSLVDELIVDLKVS